MAVGSPFGENAITIQGALTLSCMYTVDKSDSLRSFCQSNFGWCWKGGSCIAKIVGKSVDRLARENPGKWDSTVNMWVYEEEFQGHKLSKIINEQHENPKELRIKFTIGLELATTQKLKVTVYRTDNMADNPGVNPNFCAQPIDCLWRNITGWADPLYILFKKPALLLTIPANPSSEVAEIILDNPGFTAVSAPKNRDIPRQIYQFWSNGVFEEYPVYVQKSMMSQKLLNPGYNYQLYGVNKARDYILAKEGTRALSAYDLLRPAAYKSEFWRLIAIYHEGGIFSDAKLTLFKPLDVSLPEKGSLIVDDRETNSIFNGFFACVKNDPWLRKAIDMIITNIELRSYGADPMSITGSKLLYSAFEALPSNNKTKYTHYYYEPRGLFIWESGAAYPTAGPHNGEYHRALTKPGTTGFIDYWYGRIVYGAKASLVYVAAKDIAILSFFAFILISSMAIMAIKRKNE